MATLRAETDHAGARRLPPARRLRPAERARLAAEILAAYRRARRELRRAPIESAVAALRAGPPEAPSAMGPAPEPPPTMGPAPGLTPATEPVPRLTPATEPAPRLTPATEPEPELTPATEPAPGLTPADGALVEAHRLGRAVGRTLRLLPGDTRCLARSLVLTRLLARRGIPAKLVIGARADPDFLAHAWVECAGHAVLPAGDGSYGRLVEL
ncbi:MAG TPA: lasso peptide biosynthesis B2 protein [Solirubrobacteraceae bacterium]|jgi:hypothetical protein|nr:lasso peptide biosynthesis B2 protein [Solirubrobacteraceae bacterium]